MNPPPKRPSEDYDEQVEDLASEYGKAALILAGILASLSEGAITARALRAARAAISGTLRSLLAVSGAWVDATVPAVYRRGVGDALGAVEGPTQDELRRQVEETMNRDEHRDAVEDLSAQLRADLEGAVQALARDAEKAMRDIKLRNARAALVAGYPLSRSRRMVEDLEKAGLAVEDEKRGLLVTTRSGRRWDAEDYAAVVLRTHVAGILNAGHLNKALEIGSLYVRVFDGGPGDVDEPCNRANGQVWHVAYAAAHLLEHPNCRRSFAALPPDYDGPVDKGPDDLEQAA